MKKTSGWLGRLSILVVGCFCCQNPLFAQGSGCAVAPPGLVSWWRAEGSALDALGTNAGTLVNGVGFSPGVAGEAFSFDGVDDFVKVPQSGDLNVSNQLTIEFWMKADPSNSLNSYQGLVTSDFYGVEVSNGYNSQRMGINFFISTDSGATVSPGSFPDTADANGGGAVISSGEWHHVAGTYDGSKLQLYIDGQPWGAAALHSGTISPMLANSFLTIGAENGRTIWPQFLGPRYFKGLIDEPSVYNRALSASEILALYIAGSAGKCVPQTGGSFLLDVDFGAGLNPSSKIGGAAIGQTTNDFWNFYTRDDGFGNPRTNGLLSDLKLVNGSATQIGMAVSNAPGATGNGSTDPMYENCVYPFDGGNVTVAITNLPEGKYDVFVYGSDGNYELNSSGISYGVKKTYENPVVNPPVWTQGVQYARFTNVQVIAGQPMVLTIRPGVGSYAIISGLQISSASTTTTSCTPSPSGLISWWKGEADGSDSAGANHGMLLNGASFGLGEVGQGFSFNGNNQCVQIPHDANLITSNFCVEAWVKPAGQVSDAINQDLIFGQSYGACQLVVRPGVNGLRVVFQFGTSHVNFYEVMSVGDIPIGEFSHIAGTWDGKTLRLYINGALNAESTPGALPVDSGCPFYIGGFYSPGSDDCAYVGQFFNGLIDELSFYNRSLSGPEIQSIFNAGNDGKCPLSTSLSIISNPSSASVFAGSNVTFSVTAVGSGSLHYQWRHEDVLIPGAIQSSLILSNVQAADEGNYSVVVTNLYRSATSSNALLTVIPLAPSIIVQPKDCTVYVGSNATFSVAATGTQPMTYQWRFNELDLPGRTNASLTITNAQLADGGYYSAVVSNKVGFTTSSNVLLTVKLPPPCTPPPAGLVAWWRFENDLLDNWGINNATAPYSRFFTAGKVGRAFNLASSYLIVPDSPSLRFTNALTVECWVNSSSFAGSTPRTILSKFDSPTYQPTGTQSSFYLGTTNNGSVYFVVSGGGSVRTNTSLLTAQTLSANQWSFVVATYDGASLRIYINGTLAAQKSYSGGIFAGSAPLGIGALPFATQSYTWPMPALIDEVALYNRALSESEVRSIYESDFIGKCLVAPEITVQPLSQPAPQGEDVQFSVSVLGSRPLKFQWRFNGTNILGATNSNLVLEKVRDANTGFYSVAVSNAVGGIVSASAQLKLLPAPECISVPEGLISWWPVDGSGVDAAGGNNVPSVYSTVYVTGKVDRALSFNGYSSRVTIASSASLNFSSNVNFSIEGWVKAWPGYSPLRPPFPPYPNMPILEKRSGSDATGAGYPLSLNQGRLAFWLGTASKTATNAPLYISNGPDLRDGMFHHIAATVDRSSTNGGNLFVDGALVFTFDPTTRTGDLNNTSTLYIGAPTSTTANSYFYGLIDEMAMYRRALSADEIHSIATAGSAGKCKVPPSIQTQPLDQVVKTSSNATFTVLAVGSPTLRYQWFKGTASLAWATNSAFSITNVQGFAAGLYSVRVANAFGSITSSNALLTVEPLTILPSGGVLQFSQGGDQWMLKFTGVAGQNYQIQTSTNLVDWIDVGAATDLGDGRFEFVDPDAMSREAGFYRVVQP